MCEVTKGEFRRQPEEDFPVLPVPEESVQSGRGKEGSWWSSCQQPAENSAVQYAADFRIVPSATSPTLLAIASTSYDEDSRNGRWWSRRYYDSDGCHCGQHASGRTELGSDTVSLGLESGAASGTLSGRPAIAPRVSELPAWPQLIIITIYWTVEIADHSSSRTGRSSIKRP